MRRAPVPPRKTEKPPPAPAPPPPAAPAPVAPAVPDWFPPWARELAELYFSGSTCLFLLSGNVHDLVRSPGEDGDEYGNLADFLAGQVFGSWDLVLEYDLARGLRPQPAGDEKRLQSMVKQLGQRL